MAIAELRGAAPLRPLGGVLRWGAQRVGRVGHGAGIAALLMTDVEARLAASGTRRAWLDCAIGNLRAARFYEKCGWQRTGVVTTTLGTSPLEIWRYEKDLAR